MVALAAAMVVLLVAAVLTTLRLTETWPFETTSSSVEEALEYIPDDVTSVQIRDQGAAEQRLGIDDIETGASDADIERYLAASRNAPWVANIYTSYLDWMSDTAFTALDVDWSASVVSGPVQESLPRSISLTQLYGMDPALDLAEVGDALADAGWKRSDVDGGWMFEVEVGGLDPLTSTAGGYPASGFQMVLLPDQHLIVTGDYEPVLDVIAGDSDSLGTSDDVSELLEDTDDAEYVYVTRGSGTCSPNLGLPRATPTMLEKLWDRYDASGLGIPSVTASLVLADGDTLTTESRLLFDNEDAAAEDKAAREKFLRESTNSVTNEPIVDVLEVDEITVDGASETIEYTFERGTSVLLSAIGRGQLSPIFCVDR